MTLRSTLLGAALVLTVPAAALAADGFYVGVGAGLNMTRDADTSFSGGALDGTSTDMDFNRGFAGTLSGGYKFSNGLRTELELGLRNNAVDNFGGDASGRVRSLSLMGNVLYDINTGTAFTPYLGAGLGYARVKASGINGAGAIAAVNVDDSDSKFAYQGIVGVAYNFNPNLALTLDYRYMGTGSPDFAVSPAATATSADSEYRNHTLMAGLRVSFGAMPAPTPAPAPAPVVQAQREFLVFFDFDASAISPQAAKTIADAAATATSTNTIRLDVIGHTDTSGSPDYNMRLSQRRAEAVKAELIRRGIAANKIVVAWKGESQLMVATADGVREPSNRRAAIGLTIQ